LDYKPTKRGKGWHGNREGHQEAAIYGRYQHGQIRKQDYGSGGFEQRQIYLSNASIAQAARFNSALMEAKRQGSELRGAEVEKIWYRQVLGYTREQYAQYCQSYD
jgi:hypothetical protein